MVDKEKKSFIVPPTEVKNYDIQDIYDLEDCVEVFESIVEELQQASTKSEQNTVKNTKLIAKYIYMEDSIIEGLEKLPKLASTKEMQQRLLDVVTKFNKCSSEYQDTWKEDIWHLYESTRNPKKSNSDFQQVKSHQQINKQLLDLQDIAITLTRLSRGNSGDMGIASRDPFAVVDEESSKYKEPSVKEAGKSVQCDACVMV